MAKHYTGLFEDEVADVLRSAGPDVVIMSGPFSWHRSGMLVEDGVYTSGAGYVTEYIDGASSGTVHRSRLVSRLAHTDFDIMEV